MYANEWEGERFSICLVLLAEIHRIVSKIFGLFGKFIVYYASYKYLYRERDRIIQVISLYSDGFRFLLYSCFFL